MQRTELRQGQPRRLGTPGLGARAGSERSAAIRWREKGWLCWLTYGMSFIRKGGVDGFIKLREENAAPGWACEGSRSQFTLNREGSGVHLYPTCARCQVPTRCRMCVAASYLSNSVMRSSLKRRATKPR